MEFGMKNSMFLIIFIALFQGCATWNGIKQDSNEVWQGTKEVSGKAYDSTKRAIHDITE